MDAGQGYGAESVGARAQAAFRGQAQKLHPDHVSDPATKAEATKQFQKLSEAYQTLRDPTKRRLYDQGSY